MVKQGETFAEVSESDLPAVADEIVSRLSEAKVWLFHGDLGAGKTTLIKAVGDALGVDDAMSSPSFSIVNEYHAAAVERVYHFDFYRLRSEMEALDIGVEEYFYSGYPCFIEWPEKVPSLIPSVRGEVTLRIDSETTRTIVITVHAG